MLLYDNNGHRNWVTNVKRLLFSTGFGYVWQDQNIVSDNFIHLFTQRLKDMFFQTWHEKIALSTKCDLYSIFKDAIKQNITYHP